MQCLYCFFMIRNKQKIDFIQLKHFSPTCQIAAICYYHIIKLFVFCLCSLFHHSTIKETQLQHFLIITIYFCNNNFFHIILVWILSYPFECICQQEIFGPDTFLYGDVSSIISHDTDTVGNVWKEKRSTRYFSDTTYGSVEAKKYPFYWKQQY